MNLYKITAYVMRALCVPLSPFVVLYCLLAVGAEKTARKGLEK